MRTLTAIALLLVLGGCGFEPLYAPPRGSADGSADTVPAMLETIAIVAGDDRLAQELRNHLIAALTPHGYPASPRYRLEFDLHEQVEGFAFRSDRAVTRERLALRARFRLTDIASADTVLDEESTAWSSFDVVQSDFANISAQRDARSRAAEILAQRIAARLAGYFRRAGPEGTGRGQGES